MTLLTKIIELISYYNQMETAGGKNVTADLEVLRAMVEHNLLSQQSPPVITSEYAAHELFDKPNPEDKTTITRRDMFAMAALSGVVASNRYSQDECVHIAFKLAKQAEFQRGPA